MSIRGEKWVDLGDTVIARLETHGEKFEILVDPNKAWEYRRGQNIDLSEVLKSFDIFDDAHKGLKATEGKLLEIFETTDINKIAPIILKKGFIQLTTEQRREITNNKKMQISYEVSVPNKNNNLLNIYIKTIVSLVIFQSKEWQIKIKILDALI